MSNDWDGKSPLKPGQRVRVKLGEELSREEINCCADVVGFHAKRPVLWLHENMEYRAIHPEFILPIRTEAEQEFDELQGLIQRNACHGAVALTELLIRNGYRKQ